MFALQILVLALVQGITEFLPISSSAHLILVPALTGWPDQGVGVDVAVHVGTLGAVMLYFRQDVMMLVRGGLAVVGLGGQAADASASKRLFIHLVIATIPVVLAGLALKLLDLDDALRSPLVIAWASIGFGLLLYAVDQFAPKTKHIREMGWGEALMMGFAQMLALIPGTSRAGATMTAARALGYTRPQAARFSMLMSIPTILAAGTLLTLDVVQESAPLGMDAAIAAGLSFLAALGAIHFLMRWLEHASMTIFVIYRVLLGIGLLWWFL